MDITTLSPAEVWKNFAEICAIPHASGNEKQLSCFLAEKAEKMGEVVPCDDLPKSFVLTTEYGCSRVHLTALSTHTLEKRLK